jgi:hypothetical protein
MPAVRKRILITVKTYPNPSSKYDETVCTAGIDLDSGRLIRLYPVRFRHLGFADQFKKWDILELDVEHKRSDPRGDTWMPVSAEYQVVGHIGTGKGKPPDWAERSALVFPLVSTIEELQEAARDRSCSLGVVKVHGPARLRAVPDPGGWDSAQLAIMGQQNLLGPQLRPLEKLPYQFMYDFYCCSSCPGHSYRLLDWEAFALFRGQRDKKHDAAAAAGDVEHQYNVRLGIEARDVHLFVGTHYLRHTQFSANGVFYPPRAG